MTTFFVNALVRDQLKFPQHNIITSRLEIDDDDPFVIALQVVPAAVAGRILRESDGVIQRPQFTISRLNVDVGNLRLRTESADR